MHADMDDSLVLIDLKFEIHIERDCWRCSGGMEAVQCDARKGRGLAHVGTLTGMCYCDSHSHASCSLENCGRESMTYDDCLNKQSNGNSCQFLASTREYLGEPKH